MPSLCAHDPRAYTIVQAERVADSHDPFTNFKIIGIAQFDGGQLFRDRNLYQGHIGSKISSNDMAVKFSLVKQFNRDLFGTLDDMSVGQYYALGCNNKPRTLTTLGHLAGRWRHTKKSLHRLIFGLRLPALFAGHRCTCQ